MFEEKYIFRIDERITRDEILEKVGKVFYEDNIVKEEFISAIKKEKKSFLQG